MALLRLPEAPVSSSDTDYLNELVRVLRLNLNTLTTRLDGLNTSGNVTVVSNAGTCSSKCNVNTFTNTSDSAMSISMPEVGMYDTQILIVRIYDYSASAETLSWVNTENSTVSVPTTSNGSTTLPLIVTFMFNAKTLLWRCIQSV